jgi:hypothetical protein
LQDWLVTVLVQRLVETEAPSLRVQLVTVRVWLPEPQVELQAPHEAYAGV